MVSCKILRDKTLSSNEPSIVDTTYNNKLTESKEHIVSGRGVCETGKDGGDLHGDNNEGFFLDRGTSV